jgi:hypothetical protein
MSVYGLSARIVLLLGTLTVSLFTSSASYAVMTVVIEEQGADVVMSASGTINLNGLGSVTNGTCNSGINAFTGLAVAGGSNVPCDFYAIPSPTPSPRAGFGGAVDGVSTATSGTGIAGTAGTANAPTVTLPSGYISGGSISASATFAGTDLATLELTPGTYTVSWGSGADADSVVVEIRAPSATASPQPVPALPALWFTTAPGR